MNPFRFREKYRPRGFGNCDIFLTPIAAEDYVAMMNERSPQMYVEYLMNSEVQHSIGGDGSTWADYLSRAWCRTEMFLASHVPHCVPSGMKESQRLQLISSKKLVAALATGKRPHFYCDKVGNDPVVLAPLLHSFLDDFHPANGQLTQESDRPRIVEFMEQVCPKYLEKPVPFYSGDKDTEGKKDGEGKEMFPNGDIFEGLYVKDMHSVGTMFFSSGNKFTGDFNENGERHGLGKMEYFFGNTFYGIYEASNLMIGVIEYENCAAYIGELQGGRRHGVGIYLPNKIMHDKQYKKFGVWKNDDYEHEKSDNDIEVSIKPICDKLSDMLKNRSDDDILKKNWFTSYHNYDTLKKKAFHII